MRIAHISDPHVNLKFHPQHLPRLRRVLENALERNADHIVITGDLTSNGDARDLRATRRLFESLGILSSSKLSLVLGNHDIFGGPHLAEDVLSFPERCKKCDYDEKVAIFQDTFAEVFSETITNERPYPYLKRVRNICFLGLNTIARHSLIENPVGSNGKIPKAERNLIEQLTEHHAWQTATQRIVLMHHHLFRKKDISHLQIAEGIAGSGLVALIEQSTLKLHSKRHVLSLFEDIGVDAVLHGHVHFTGEYVRREMLCLNSAGAVFPISRAHGYHYQLLELKPYKREVTTVMLAKPAEKTTEVLVAAA